MRIADGRQLTDATGCLGSLDPRSIAAGGPTLRLHRVECDDPGGARGWRRGAIVPFLRRGVLIDQPTAGYGSQLVIRSGAAAHGPLVRGNPVSTVADHPSPHWQPTAAQPPHLAVDVQQERIGDGIRRAAVQVQRDPPDCSTIVGDANTVDADLIGILPENDPSSAGSYDVDASSLVDACAAVRGRRGARAHGAADDDRGDASAERVSEHASWTFRRRRLRVQRDTRAGARRRTVSAGGPTGRSPRALSRRATS